MDNDAESDGQGECIDENEGQGEYIDENEILGGYIDENGGQNKYIDENEGRDDCRKGPNENENLLSTIDSVISTQEIRVFLTKIISKS